MSEKPVKVVVTGGAGFVGSNLVDELVRLNYEVHVVDNLVSGKREQVNLKATLHIVDIRNIEEIKKIFIGAQGIFHLAALPGVPYSIENPIETTDVNLMGTIRVLIAARDAGVKRVIYSSSASVYGDQEILPIHEELKTNPQSPYGLQKLESELNCALFSNLYTLETVSLRYFNIYGPRQGHEGPYASVIPKFIRLKKESRPLAIIGTGEQTRDFVHVKDVVSANLAAFLSKRVGRGEFINVGFGKNYSVNSIASIIGGPTENLPPRREIFHSVASVKKAKELLGWEPKIPLEEGIKDLIDNE